MTIEEREALTQAQLRGYLLKFVGMSFEVSEAWWLSCSLSGRPMISIGVSSKGKTCVMIDTESIQMFQMAHKGWCYGAPSLVPTEKMRASIQRLIKKWGPASFYGSCLALYGVWDSQAEQVAQMLLEVWQEAKVFAEQVSLWELSA